MTDDHTKPTLHQPDASGTSPRFALLRWGFTGILAVLAGALVVYKVKAPPPDLDPPPKELSNVAVQGVTFTTHRQRLILPARLAANRSIGLSFELNGCLERCQAPEGAVVQAGAVIATINTADLQAELAHLLARQQSAERAVSVAEQNIEGAGATRELAEKDTESQQLQLSAAQANLLLAEKDYARIKTLAESSIAAEAEYDRVSNLRTQATLTVARAQNALERAAVAVQAAQTRVRQTEASRDLDRSRVQEIQSAIAALKVTIGKATITAPFTGKLDEYLVEAGEVVATGQIIGHFYDLEKVRALVDVPDRYIPLLDRGNLLVDKYVSLAMPGAKQELRAHITIPGLPKLAGGAYAGVQLDATIDRVAQAADPASNTFRVELLLSNPGEALKQGMIVEAQIDFLRYDDALVIPLKAVQVTDAGPRVFVVADVSGHSIVQVRDVEPVSIEKETILVRGGLAEGDRLIVAGWKGLVDGEEVQVVIEDGHLHGVSKSAAPGSKESAPE